MNASPDHSRPNPAATTLRAWLLSDAPASRRQATLGLAYRRWRRFAGNPLNLLGLAILAALVAIALVAPFVMPHDPLRQVLADRLLPPGSRRTGSAPTSSAATSSRV